MQGRGSVTAAHSFFCRDARTTVTVRTRTKLLTVFKSKAAVTSEAPVTKGHTGASGFRLRGETNGGEGSPPRRHSNALMCLFSNAHGLLRCHQHSRARHDLRLWKQPCHSLGNLPCSRWPLSLHARLRGITFGVAPEQLPGDVLTLEDLA